MLGVGDLRFALEDVPDEMELVVEVHGNQHYVSGIGIAERGNDQIYRFPKPRCPPGSIVIEGSFFVCAKCKSSVKRNWFFKIVGCIQPECPNYYLRKKLVVTDNINFLIKG